MSVLVQNSINFFSARGPVIVQLLCPAPRVGSIKRWCANDVWRLSVAYVGPQSRTERPRKTKIGTEVAHVTVTRTPLLGSEGQRWTCRGRGHIVAASRTACLFLTFTDTLFTHAHTHTHNLIMLLGHNEVKVIRCPWAVSRWNTVLPSTGWTVAYYFDVFVDNSAVNLPWWLF